MIKRMIHINIPKIGEDKNKDIKIIKTISIIITLSLSVIMILGVLAVYYMGKINNNGQKIYNTYLQKIINLNDVKNNVTEINSSLDALYRAADSEVYTTNSANIDNGINKITQTSLKNYVSKISNKDEKSMYEAFNKKLNDITTNWNQIKQDYTSTQYISKDKISILRSDGKDLSNDITSLVIYNEQLSGKINNSNTKIYNTNKVLFVTIFISAFIVLLFMFLFVVKFIKKSVLNMNKILKDISVGDFTVFIDTTNNSEFGHMKGELKKTLLSLSNIFNNIKKAASNINEKASNLSAISEEMSSSTQEVAAAVQDVSKDATNQAGELLDTNKVIDDFSFKIDNITTDIANVDEKSNQISSMAKSKNADMKMVVDTIGDLNNVFKDIKVKIAGLGSSINKIGEITGVINSIAKQTNLLSLNAAIEAARAGEAGKGFAVVADEVRKLAEQSSSSSQSINKLIDNISHESTTVINSTEELSSKFTSQLDVIKESIDSYMDIVKSLEDMMPKIGSISNSANGIMRSKETLLKSIETASAQAQNISASSEEIASSVEEMSSSSKDTADTAQYLSGLTEDMMQQINKFKF